MFSLCDILENCFPAARTRHSQYGGLKRTWNLERFPDADAGIAFWTG